MQRPINALKFCKTLDDLCAGLLKQGYVLSRQTLYFPLIPRRFDNVEGKQHVGTVPVKLGKGENNMRNWHINAGCTFATKGFPRDIVRLFW